MESTWVDTILDLNINSCHRTNTSIVNLGFSHKRESELPDTDESGVLAEELNRVSAENKKLTEILTVLSENYNSLQHQFMEFIIRKNWKFVSSISCRSNKNTNTWCA